MRVYKDFTYLLLYLVVCCSPAWSEESNDLSADIHLLNRITMGPSAQDLATLRRIGRQAYIERELNPQSIPESDQVVGYINKTDALNLTPIELFRQYGPPAIMRLANSNSTDLSQMNNQFQNQNVNNAVTVNANGGVANDQNNVRQERAEARKELFKEIGQQTTAAKVLRAVGSRRQLQEVMTDFWFNHFNVSIDKGLDHIWTGSYEQQAIRPYALGKFRDLLEATSHHPAMLFYLDNWENTAPNSQGARGQFKGINENYARELMELHTLGVDGGYTQKDVTELARILTGLGLPPRGRAARFTDGQISRFGSYFDSNRHDFGDKIFLGYRIKGSGENEVEQALDILARNLATAHHICYQLAQYFISDTPSATLVNKLAAKFRQTDGDIKAVMNELLHSPDFWDPANYNSKYKNPFRYAISALRVSNVLPDDSRAVTAFLRAQGMPIYACLTPDGYKNTRDAWLNSDALLRRINFATGVATGRLLKTQPADYNEIKGTIYGEGISSKTSETIENAPLPMKAALLLGSPEFMRY